MKRIPKKALKEVPEIVPDDLTTRLDASTQELWIRVAQAHSFGLGDTQIAKMLGVDPALMKRLTASVTFQAFESTYKLVHQDTIAIRERISTLGDKSVDALEWVIESRDPENMNAIRGAAVDVLKMILDVKDSKGGTQKHLHLHAHLPDNKSRQLFKALQKVGA